MIEFSPYSRFSEGDAKVGIQTEKLEMKIEKFSPFLSLFIKLLKVWLIFKNKTGILTTRTSLNGLSAQLGPIF